MPRMMTMWAVAGGSAVAAASLTYLIMRAGMAPIVGAVGRGWRRARERLPRSMQSRDAFTISHSEDSDPSGHSAYRQYRDDVVRKLDAEELEFRAFRERLHHARDRREFDAFMAERRNRPHTSDDSGQAI